MLECCCRTYFAQICCGSTPKFLLNIFMFVFWCRKGNKNMWYKRKREYHSAILSIVVGQTLNLNNLSWRKRQEISLFFNFNRTFWNRNNTLILFLASCRETNWCYKVFLINMLSLVDVIKLQNIYSDPKYNEIICYFNEDEFYRKLLFCLTISEVNHLCSR